VLQEFVATSGVRVVGAKWMVAINLVDDVPGKRSLPVAILPPTKGVADRRVVRWFEDMLEHFGRCPQVQGFSSYADPSLIRQFLRPVAARILNMDWGMRQHICAKCPVPRPFLPSGAGHSLRHFPDARHLLKSFRGRSIKGEAAPLPSRGARAQLWRSRTTSAWAWPWAWATATITDRSCYGQDDMNHEEM
jgi:hypothetical protein